MKKGKRKMVKNNSTANAKKGKVSIMNIVNEISTLYYLDAFTIIFL